MANQVIKELMDDYDEYINNRKNYPSPHREVDSKTFLGPYGWEERVWLNKIDGMGKVMEEVIRVSVLNGGNDLGDVGCVGTVWNTWTSVDVEITPGNSVGGGTVQDIEDFAKRFLRTHRNYNAGSSFKPFGENIETGNCQTFANCLWKVLTGRGSNPQVHRGGRSLTWGSL